MRNYLRKPFFSTIFIFFGTIFFLSGIMQLQPGNYFIALLKVFVGLLFFTNAYAYRKPYLGLGEGHLIVNRLFSLKKIKLTNLSIDEETDRNIIVSYTEKGSTIKLIITLSLLREPDRQQFVHDLHAQLSRKH